MTGIIAGSEAWSSEGTQAAKDSKEFRAVAPDDGEPPAPLSPALETVDPSALKSMSAMPPAGLQLSKIPSKLSEADPENSLEALELDAALDWDTEPTESNEVLAAGVQDQENDPSDNPLRSRKESRQNKDSMPSGSLKSSAQTLSRNRSSVLQLNDNSGAAPDPDINPTSPSAANDEARVHLESDQPPAPPGTKTGSTVAEKPKRDFDPEDNEHPEGLEKTKVSSSSDSGLKLSEPKKTSEAESEETNEPAASELLNLIPEQNQSNSNSKSSKKADLSGNGGAKIDSAKPRPSPSDTREVSPLPPTKTLPKLSQQVGRLKPRIDNALAYYLNRPETTVQRSPWAVMHAIIPFGVESTLKADGRTVNAIGWMCFNGSCRGQRIFQVTPTGFKPALGAGLQGHEGQFLAILAQSKVAPEYPLQVGRKRYSVNDLIDYEMKTCKSKTELTFKLLSLSHYLPSDAQWKNEQGETWSIEKLVEEELAQPIVGAACGGTHRLMGLSYALSQRRAEGFPIEGHFARAQVFLNDFIDYAWTLQNPDGSFSTDWFEGRANQSDMQRKLQTTGHILEWLVFVLPEDQLQSPRVVRAVEFLLYCLVDQRQTDWKIGPRGHALHALSLYEERLFGAVPGQLRRQLTASGTKSKQR